MIWIRAHAVNAALTVCVELMNKRLNFRAFLGGKIKRKEKLPVPHIIIARIFKRAGLKTNTKRALNFLRKRSSLTHDSAHDYIYFAVASMQKSICYYRITVELR